jgi:hypothetical protein
LLGFNRRSATKRIRSNRSPWVETHGEFQWSLRDPPLDSLGSRQ